MQEGETGKETFGEVATWRRAGPEPPLSEACAGEARAGCQQGGRAQGRRELTLSALQLPRLSDERAGLGDSGVHFSPNIVRVCKQQNFCSVGVSVDYQSV